MTIVNWVLLEDENEPSAIIKCACGENVNFYVFKDDVNYRSDENVWALVALHRKKFVGKFNFAEPDRADDPVDIAQGFCKRVAGVSSRNGKGCEEQWREARRVLQSL